MATATPEFVVDWPTLFVAHDWAQAHAVVPDGFDQGAPWVFADWQAWCWLNHYRVREDAEVGQLATAFFYRRSQVTLPQKAGKGPWTAVWVLNEAVGPSVFDGFAEGGEQYRCSDHGCPCGWVYEYLPDEAMAIPRPTPLIQITATSEDQTDNIYKPLRAMIKHGPLAAVITKTGEEFTRLPGGGEINVVTSNAQSRLGNPITAAAQDETGIWTKANGMVKVAETQRRGLAGMGGRALETTNAWDPNEDSVAQRTSEAKVDDVFRYHPQAPAHLSYGNKEERRKIHRFVYRGSKWVDLDAIDAEAAELFQVDPAQAERFFGNRLGAGAGKAFDLDHFKTLYDAEKTIERGRTVVGGYDPALTHDTTGFVVVDVITGHQIVLASWTRPEHLADEDDWTVPIDELNTCVEWLFEHSGWKVWRVYCDPEPTKEDIARWAGRYGKDRVVYWWTNQRKQIGLAIKAWKADQRLGVMSYGPAPEWVPQFGDELTHEERARLLESQVGNAVKSNTAIRDDADRKFLFVIKKLSPKSRLKIDLAMSAILAWVARADALRAGVGREYAPPATFHY